MSGVRFSEVMKGRLVGDDGRHTSSAVMRATVSIEDLQSFFDDPDHRGHLTGHVYIPAISPQPLPANGHVRLFAMGRIPGERIMEYTLEFDTGRTAYAFVGTKFVDDGAGFDAWHDVTTLHVSVADIGAPSAERPSWTGRMSLSLLAAMRLLTTLRGVGGTIPSNMRAVVRFAFFFLREVGERYLPARSDGGVGG